MTVCLHHIMDTRKGYVKYLRATHNSNIVITFAAFLFSFVESHYQKVTMVFEWDV